MFTILVPTDHSDAARAAANYAAALAAHTGGGLVLFHAYLLPTPVTELPYALVTADALQMEAEQALQREAERLNRQFGVSVEKLARIGIPSTEIQIITEERPISLVVMGMKGETGLDVLWGSTTIHTLKKVKTPVLVIPEHTVFKTPSTLTLAVDFTSEINPAALHRLNDIVQTFGCALQVLHIQTADQMLTPDEIAGKVKWGNLLSHFQVSYHSETAEDVTDGLHQFQDKSPADLLVMIAQRKSFWEKLFGKSDTRHFAQSTTHPLLILSNEV